MATSKQAAAEKRAAAAAEAENAQADLDETAADAPVDAVPAAEAEARDADDREPRVRRRAKRRTAQTDESQRDRFAAVRAQRGWTWDELGDFLEQVGDTPADQVAWVREQALSDPSRPPGRSAGANPAIDDALHLVEPDVKANYRSLRAEKSAARGSEYTWQEMADDALARGASQSLINWMLSSPDRVDDDAEDSED